MRISGVVRTFCKTAKILELHAKIVPEFPGADGHLQVTASEPEGLIEAVSALLKPCEKEKRAQFPSRCSISRGVCAMVKSHERCIVNAAV